MFNNARVTKGVAYAFNATLGAVTMLAASPALPHPVSSELRVIAPMSNDFHRALDEARVGNLEPIEALLVGPPAGNERLLLEAQRAAALLREQETSEALRR